MKKVNVWFDMDGTIADLYGTKGWLKAIRSEESEIFRGLAPMLNTWTLFSDIEELGNLYRVDLNIGVITWTPMEATYRYQKECELAKISWLDNRYLLDTKRFFAIPYGTPKQSVIKIGCKDYQILIDDNEEVIKRWQTKKLRKSVNAKHCFDSDSRTRYRENILTEVEKILENIVCEG